MLFTGVTSLYKGKLPRYNKVGNFKIKRYF